MLSFMAFFSIVAIESNIVLGGSLQDGVFVPREQASTGEVEFNLLAYSAVTAAQGVVRVAKAGARAATGATTGAVIGGLGVGAMMGAMPIITAIVREREVSVVNGLVAGLAALQGVMIGASLGGVLGAGIGLAQNDAKTAFITTGFVMIGGHVGAVTGSGLDLARLFLNGQNQDFFMVSGFVLGGVMGYFKSK